jgi:hypothetical protein
MPPGYSLRTLSGEFVDLFEDGVIEQIPCA